MEPHLVDPETLGMRMAQAPVAGDLSQMNISEPFGILALYLTGREEIVSMGAGLPLNTVVKNRLAHLWPKQTLLPRRSDALGDLNRASLNPLAIVEPARDDPARFEGTRESLDRCAEARGLYLRSADQVAAGNIMRGVSLLGEALDTCELNGVLTFPLSEYYMLLSRRQKAEGRLEDAVQAARRAVELDPLGPATFYNLASIELENDPATATALLARATELDPGYIPGYLLKAKAELADARPRDATGTVGRVLSVEPFNPIAHHLKGLSLIQREQYEAGRLELERALEGMPGNLDLMEAIAYSWIMQGRMNRAGSLYRKVLEAEPDRFGALNNYATVLAEQGKLEEAVATWTRALALSPGNPDIMANIEEARQKMRR
jgi:tetratricopeptide (TPR) repeat protein